MGLFSTIKNEAYRFITNNSSSQDKLTVQGATSVTVNGRTYQGNNIVVLDGSVFIDGELVDSTQAQAGVFNVTVYGNPTKVETVNGDITVHGDVTNVETVNGDISAKTISGSVHTVNGDIN